MNNFLLNLNWKVLLALGIILLILGAGSIFLLGRLSSKVTSLSVTPTPSSAADNWKVYYQSDYSISYPPEASISARRIQGGGRELDIHLAQGPSYRVELQIVPNSNTSIERISGIFRDHHYQESDIVINSKPAKKFTGTMLTSLPTGNIVLQEIAALVENNGQIYRLELIYYKPQRNSEVDNLFLKILATFRF